MLTPKNTLCMPQENTMPSVGSSTNPYVMQPIIKYADNGRPSTDYYFGGTGSTPQDYDDRSYQYTDDRSWWQKNWDDLLIYGAEAVAVATGQGWLLPFIQGGGVLLDSYLDREYQEKMYEKMKEDQIAAEKRANEEYDRRDASARAYNDSWADRMRSQGFNPLAAISKGSGVTATHSSSPSTTSMPAMPNFRGANALGVGTAEALEALLTLAQVKNIEAQTKNTEARTEGQQQENETYLERFTAEMASIASSVRNTTAQARINESAANVAEATQSWNIEAAQYHVQQLVQDLRRGNVDIEIATVALQQARDNLLRSALERQLLGQQIVMNGQTININDITFEQFQIQLAEFKQTADARTRAAIAQFESDARQAEVAANWAGINQFTDNFGKLANGVSSVVSSIKPGISVTTSTTESVKYNAKGKETVRTVTKNSSRRE